MPASEPVREGGTFCQLTFGVEGPVRPVVLQQANALLLAQPADLRVELPGDVDVRRRDRPRHALGAEEPVDLGGRREDAEVGGGAQDEAHVGLGQVEVARRQEHGGVRAGGGEQALWERAGSTASCLKGGGVVSPE